MRDGQSTLGDVWCSLFGHNLINLPSAPWSWCNTCNRTFQRGEYDPVKDLTIRIVAICAVLVLSFPHVVGCINDINEENRRLSVAREQRNLDHWNSWVAPRVKFCEQKGGWAKLVNGINLPWDVECQFPGTK